MRWSRNPHDWHLHALAAWLGSPGRGADKDRAGRGPRQDAGADSDLAVLQAALARAADPRHVAGEYGAASDVFSFGVVLLELLTGAPPVDPAQHPHLLYARMRARLPVLAEEVADPAAGWAELQGGLGRRGASGR
jgi:hypothetical protein